MLSPRGWSLVGAAAALAAGSRVLGLLQLLVLAVAAGAAVVVAAAWVRSRATDVSVVREIPTRPHVGDDLRVEITLGAGGRGAPRAELADQVDGGRRVARFRAPPLPPGGRARGAYRIPTDRRGRHTIGPGRWRVEDPMGLARRDRSVTSAEEVLVLPRVHLLVPPPRRAGDDHEGRRAPHRDHLPGDEFLTLRPYQVGDDLRQVHWRSTARQGTLMIRQEESRARAPVRLLLDVRSDAHDRDSFERAVEAVASLATTLVRDHRPLEVSTTTGRVVGAAGRRFLASLLDALASVEPEGPHRITLPAGVRSTAYLIAVTGALTAADATTLSGLVRPGGTLVRVDVRAPDGPPTRMRTGPRSTLVVAAGPDRDLPAAWNDAILRWTRAPASPSPR